VLHRFSITETALLTVGRIDSEAGLLDEVVSAGHSVADKSLILVDNEGRTVPRGAMGELAVRSAYWADGYWRRPEETSLVFKPDPEVRGRESIERAILASFVLMGLSHSWGGGITR